MPAAEPDGILHELHETWRDLHRRREPAAELDEEVGVELGAEPGADVEACPNRFVRLPLPVPSPPPARAQLIHVCVTSSLPPPPPPPPRLPLPPFSSSESSSFPLPSSFAAGTHPRQTPLVTHFPVSSGRGGAPSSAPPVRPERGPAPDRPPCSYMFVPVLVGRSPAPVRP